MHNTSATGISDETSVGEDFHIGHSDDLRRVGDALCHRLILLLRQTPCHVRGSGLPKGPHLGRMIHCGPKQKAKRLFGNEKSLGWGA